MAGAGVVADKTVGAREQIEQGVETGEIGVEHGHTPAGGAELRGERGVIFPGPEAGGLSGASVDDDPARGAGSS